MPKRGRKGDNDRQRRLASPAAATGGRLDVLQWLRANGCEWDSYVCIAACVLAACITLNPSAGQLWSQSASPALATMDRVISPLRVSVDPHPAPNAPSQRPVIAVIFGCIQPDETVDELTRAEKLAEYGETPEVGDVKTITQPVHWKRPIGETSYRFDAE